MRKAQPPPAHDVVSDAVRLGDAPNDMDVDRDAAADGMREELRDADDDGDAPRDSELVRDSVIDTEAARDIDADTLRLAAAAPREADAVDEPTGRDRDTLGTRVDVRVRVDDGDAPNDSDMVREAVSDAVTEDVKAELGVVDGDAPNVSDGVGNTL